MKRNHTFHAAAVLAVAAASTLLVGCGTTPPASTKAVLYRTTPVLLESEFEFPVRLSLAAGDQLGYQVRDVYLARAEGTALPAAEPFVVAQTAP